MNRIWMIGYGEHGGGMRSYASIALAVLILLLGFAFYPGIASASGVTIDACLYPVPECVGVGETFNIKGALSASPYATGIGYIDVSFPNLNPTVSIKDQSSGQDHYWIELPEIYHKGDLIFYREGVHKPAKYTLASGGVENNPGWGWTWVWFELDVTPTESGVMDIYYRGTLIDPPVTDPEDWATPYKDQQGWWVYKESVKVVKPKGSLQVTVKYPDGSAVTPDTAILYDSGWHEVKRLNPSSNTYTFTDLDPGTYHTDAYVDNMQIGLKTDIVISSGEHETATITTLYKRNLEVTVYLL